MVPSEEEFLEWLSLPMTQAYLKMLKNWREGLKERWAQRSFLHDDYDRSQEDNAAALGQANLLENLQDLDYETFFGGLSDEHE